METLEGAIRKEAGTKGKGKEQRPGGGDRRKEVIRRAKDEFKIDRRGEDCEGMTRNRGGSECK